MRLSSTLDGLIEHCPTLDARKAVCAAPALCQLYFSMSNLPCPRKDCYSADDYPKGTAVCFFYNSKQIIVTDSKGLDLILNEESWRIGTSNGKAGTSDDTPIYDVRKQNHLHRVRRCHPL